MLAEREDRMEFGREELGIELGMRDFRRKEAKWKDRGGVSSG